MPSWNWGESQSEDGVVHQSTANTDHNDAATLKQGYDYQNFSEITPDPVACWPLHEDSGTTAYDKAGTNDGAISGATVGQTGILDTTAYSFDGTDDYVDTSYTGVTGSFDRTVCCWMKTSTTSDEYFIIWGGDGSNGSLWGQSIDQENGAKPRVIFSGDYIRSDTDIGDGNWHHVCMVLEGSTVGDVKIYVDGSETGYESGSTSNLTVDTSSNYSVHIADNVDGTGANGGNSKYTGDMADVRIYHTPLTQSEIQTLYDVVNTSGTWTGTAKPL